MDNIEFAKSYLRRQTPEVFWEIDDCYNVTGLKAINLDYWYQVFKELENFGKIDKIYLQHMKWMEDILKQAQIATIDTTTSGEVATINGIKIFVDTSLPKHLAIISTGSENRKAMILVNNNWKENSLESQSQKNRIKWIIKLIEKENEHEMQTA